MLPHVRVLIDPLCVALLTHPDENTLARLGTLQSNAIKALKVISVTSNTSGQLWIVDGTFREDVFGAEMIWLQTIVHLRKHAAALNKGSLQDEAERLCTEVANLARELIDTLSTTSSQRHVMIDDLLRTLTL